MDTIPINSGAGIAKAKEFGLAIKNYTDLKTDGKPHFAKIEGRIVAYGLTLVDLGNGGSLLFGYFWRHRLGDDKPEHLWLNVKDTLKGFPENTLKQAKVSIEKARDALSNALKRELKTREKDAAKAADHIRFVAPKAEPDLDFLKNRELKPYGLMVSPADGIQVPSTIFGLSRMYPSDDAWMTIPGASVLMPMTSIKTGLIRALWTITSRGGGSVWPYFANPRETAYFLGGLITGVAILAVDFPTGATVFEALGETIPVGIVGHRRNLPHVIQAMTEKNHNVKILLCADDEFLGTCTACKAKIVIDEHDDATCTECWQPHECRNDGRLRGMRLGASVNIKALWPKFENKRELLAVFKQKQIRARNFNHLARFVGKDAVRAQFDAALNDLGWLKMATAPSPLRGTGTDGSRIIRPIESAEECLARFVLIAGKNGMVYDRKERKVYSVDDCKALCVHPEVWRLYWQSPRREIGDSANLGCDPSESDPKILFNTFPGWPIKPVKGDAEPIHELLFHLCGGSRELYHYVMCWLAYFIQKPGQTNGTCLVFHGRQGTGKSMMARIIRMICGAMATVVDQATLEDKWTDWQANLIFAVVEEAFAREDMGKLKNRMKNFIGGDTITINARFVGRYNQANLVNYWINSNEHFPVWLEQWDRRHSVIWIDEAKPKDFYTGVWANVMTGGLEALYHDILHYDWSGYSGNDLPAKTQARNDLIALGRSPIEEFLDAYESGEFIASNLDELSHNTKRINNIPVRTTDLHKLFEFWLATHHPNRKSPGINHFTAVIKKRRGYVFDANKRTRFKSATTATTHTTRMAAFIYPPNCLLPESADNMQWFFGECVRAFADTVAAYRDSLKMRTSDD